MNRDLTIIRGYPNTDGMMAKIEFNSNGRRKQRNITEREYYLLLNNIGDEQWIDNFCYKIA